MKERYLIIDGYNMIGASLMLSAIAKENLEEASMQLVVAIAIIMQLFQMKLFVISMLMTNRVLERK